MRHGESPLSCKPKSLDNKNVGCGQTTTMVRVVNLLVGEYFIRKGRPTARMKKAEFGECRCLKPNSTLVAKTSR